MAAAGRKFDRRGEQGQIIKQKKIDVDERVRNGMTSLMFAAREGHFEVVRAFCDFGASINLQDNKGNTAIGHANARMRPNIALYLREQLEKDDE